MSQRIAPVRRSLLGLVLLALGVSAAMNLWPPPAPAGAQLPDSGAQRQQQLDELRSMNRKLAEIADLLRQFKEQQAAAAPAKGEPARPR